MVFCGKPSKSCAECRSRRTKCDMLRPSCSQCIRACRVCDGYRDPRDLMFRDESEALITKARKTKSRKANSSQEFIKAPALDQTKPIAPPNMQFATVVTMSMGLNTSWEQQATAFFFRNFVPEKSSLPYGSFSYLEGLFACENVDQAIWDGVYALGFAGLSNFWKDSSMMNIATTKYTLALHRISSRMANSDEAKSDQTFAAVKLLGAYETTMYASPVSMSAWTQHSLGASALMKHRGKDQLKTRRGREMFIQHRAQIVAMCLQKKIPVPTYVSEWNSSFDGEAPVEAAATAICQIYIKYVNLVCEEHKCNQNNSTEFLLKACEIDAECVNWVWTCPPEYSYRTITLHEKTDEVYQDHYDVYSNLFIAVIWNNYRCIRILINQLIIDCLKEACSTNSLQVSTNDLAYYSIRKARSEEVILESSTEICSSVPYFLNFNPDPSAMRQPLRSFNVNLLLWPLYNAGLSNLIPREQLEWIIYRFRLISDVLSIRQVTPLMSNLRTKVNVTGWDGEGVERELGLQGALVEMDKGRVEGMREVERGIWRTI